MAELVKRSAPKAAGSFLTQEAARKSSRAEKATELVLTQEVVRRSAPAKMAMGSALPKEAKKWPQAQEVKKLALVPKETGSVLTQVAKKSAQVREVKRSAHAEESNRTDRMDSQQWLKRQKTIESVNFRRFLWALQ